MAIVRWYPAVVGPDEIPAGQMLLVDSDARDNAHAIVEVERRCSQHGLRRTKELHLAVVHSRGRRDVAPGAVLSSVPR